jgi:hypothetical protein
MMYDVKQFDKQPFLCVHSDDPVLPLRAFPPRTPVMTSLSFSVQKKFGGISLGVFSWRTASYFLTARELRRRKNRLCVHIDDPVLPLRAFPPRTPVMTSLSFSNDGKWLLVGTSGDVHYAIVTETQARHDGCSRRERPQGQDRIVTVDAEERFAGHPCVAYDPSGTVFAVALNLRSTIMMYDVKQFT